MLSPLPFLVFFVAPAVYLWIVSLEKRYRQSQIKAAVKVNAELISFYWSVGRDIASMKPEEKWGQGFYDTLSRDLRQTFPDAKGFSVRNLQRMRQFYELFSLSSNYATSCCAN